MGIYHDMYVGGQRTTCGGWFSPTITWAAHMHLKKQNLKKKITVKEKSPTAA